MYLCVRVDLDYLPWNQPAAGELPHSEPAMFIRLIEAARKLGPRLHFFASEEVLRAFPALPSAILEEGHDLDWLCSSPEDITRRFADARHAAAKWGHEFRGVAIDSQWPEGETLPQGLFFVSGKQGAAPPNGKLFPVCQFIDSELIRKSVTATSLDEDIRTLLRDFASRRVPTTVAIHLPALASIDRQLQLLQRLIEFSESIGMPIRTLRQVESDAGRPSPRF